MELLTELVSGQEHNIRWNNNLYNNGNGLTY